jgi:hypothetical protein
MRALRAARLCLSSMSVSLVLKAVLILILQKTLEGRLDQRMQTDSCSRAWSQTSRFVGHTVAAQKAIHGSRGELYVAAGVAS